MGSFTSTFSDISDHYNSDWDVVRTSKERFEFLAFKTMGVDRSSFLSFLFYVARRPPKSWVEVYYFALRLQIATYENVILALSRSQFIENIKFSLLRRQKYTARIRVIFKTSGLT